MALPKSSNPKEKRESKYDKENLETIEAFEKEEEEVELTIDHFQLMSGADIPIEELNIVMSQPKLSDIGALGEDAYFESIALLNYDKESLRDQEGIPEEVFEKNSSFNFGLNFATRDKETESNLLFFLSLVFKNYDVSVNKATLQIILKPKGVEGLDFIIDEKNCKIFLFYLNEIFYIGQNRTQKANTQSKIAEGIQKKLEEGRKKREALKGKKSNKSSALADAISAYAIMQKESIYDVYKNYTMFQFYTQLERSHLYEVYLNQLEAIRAGAKDIELEDWRRSL